MKRVTSESARPTDINNMDVRHHTKRAFKPDPLATLASRFAVGREREVWGNNSVGQVRKREGHGKRTGSGNRGDGRNEDKVYAQTYPQPCWTKFFIVLHELKIEIIPPRNVKFMPKLSNVAYL